MSADNGIYILQTRGPEFRVAHLQAVDNVYYCWDGNSGDTTDDPDVWIVNARSMWYNCEVYINEDEAWEKARKLQEEIDYTEYGISKIEIDREFKPVNFKVEVWNPVRSFDSVYDAVKFLEKDDESDTISFNLASGEYIMLKRKENGEIVLDRKNMGY